MIAREELEMLRGNCHTILDALKFLWMDRDGGFKDLQLRHVGHYMETLGQIAAIYEPVLPKYEVVFGLFARVSRQPFWSIAFTATSTTEYVLKHGIHMAQAIDGAFRNRTIRKKEGLTEEEREVYRNSWKALREPFSNSSMLRKRSVN